MNNKNYRLRFAPAPTGMMHLGNIRTALMNFLFAKKHNADFVIRVEDTDPSRNFDPEAQQIISDLDWLGITFNEGPYFQSQRTEIYQKSLQNLINNKFVYRCFCTQEELYKKRERQRALHTAPRYDRACVKLSENEIDQRVQKKNPFIWRLKLNHDKNIAISDLARGTINFECKNFSDFPLTRSDGTFTFMFANCIDDITMNITHVFRGEDHLSNTAGQAALFEIFKQPLPTFWHMPILCNIDGKKLSKRDFGFALVDLKKEGYLPEALINYLALTGSSFNHKLKTLKDIIDQYDFNNINSSGQIKYDPQQLLLLNKKWIQHLDNNDLAKRCTTFLHEEIKEYNFSQETLANWLSFAKSEMETIDDCKKALAPIITIPIMSEELFVDHLSADTAIIIINIIKAHIDKLDNPDIFLKEIKHTAYESNIKLKQLFYFIRLALMGSTQGYGIFELISMLGQQETAQRLNRAIVLLTND
jgi:glutamyl-tRNA synthetase